MQVGINYAADVLKKQLVSVINSSNLPAVVVRTVMEELCTIARDTEAKCIAQEAAEAAEANAAEKAETQTESEA